MRLTALTALALILAPHSAPGQGSCTPADTARTRAELVAVYGTLREGFMKNAPQAWIDALAPSFTLTLFDGQVMSRDWVENYVRTNAAQFRIRTLAMVLQSITRLVDTVVATVEQTSDREYSDEQGIRHRLEVGALQLETWVCTGAGWRLTKVKEHKLLYLRRDGQSSQ
jgi:uncharacterized protein DUF4440